jgi:choline kinase
MLADSKPRIAKPEAHSKIKVENGKILNKKNLRGWQYLDMGIIGINKRVLKKICAKDFDTSDLVKISTNPSLVDVGGKVLWFGCNTPEEYAYGTISFFMLKRYGRIFTPKTLS